jgi:CRP/FNR family transcriptional regulator
MIKTDCEQLFKKVFPFWDKITEEQREMLCSNTVHTNYKKGSIIHGGDSECTGGILVQKGAARAYIMSEDGREVTLYRLFPGDICMLSASCVLESITFDVFVEADEDTDCFIINGKVFAQISANNVYAENFALNIAVTRFSDVMWVMQQILFMSFDKRLAIFLYDEINKTGGETVYLTHEQIAKYTGSAREVVSRMLKYFAKEGIVEPLRGGIKIIDKSKLRALAVD